MSTLIDRVKGWANGDRKRKHLFFFFKLCKKLYVSVEFNYKHTFEIGF